MHASIAAIEYFLPERVLATAELSAMFPEWEVEKIDLKTGIQRRHIVEENQCASDLAVAASRKIFTSAACDPEEIDFLLFCTQSPDYVLPTTACLLQDRLGIPISAGALDFNLGCSGFVYGLGLAEALIASRQARLVLLITAETYSRYIKETDKISRTIFGDGAAATLVRAREGDSRSIGPFVYGTDGRGGKSLIVPNSGARRKNGLDARVENGTSPSEDGFLFMNGSELFSFAVKVVPETVKSLLRKARMTLDGVDLFVLHQANAYIMEEIRRILGIPSNKFQLTLSHCANTISSTIPIALKHAEIEGRLQCGANVMLVGFGVGYSWAATMLRWDKLV
jgi:3-oxoacyl-[acyl-carrier-protein] synthase-3